MDNRAYLSEFFNQFAYPDEARERLLTVADVLFSFANDEIQAIVGAYHYRWVLNVFLDVEDKVCEMAKKAGVHEYEARLILYALFAQKLKEYYIQQGISLEIWRDTMQDLRYKMLKCKLIHGVWGSFLRGWFAGFFQLKRFAFGKLEFELKEFKKTYTKDGILLIPDSEVVYIHIPRTGEPLTFADQDYAIKKAKEFFEPCFGTGNKIPFITGSWLLFPKNKEYLKSGSNLRTFIERFEIIDTFEYPDYSQTWRIFNRTFTKWEDMPSDTSLQRAYIEIIKKGEKTGGAYGIFFM